MKHPKMKNQKLPQIIHTLEDMDIEHSEAIGLNGSRISFLRISITSTRQVASGIKTRVVWPDLYLEPDVARSMALALESELAGLIPSGVDAQGLLPLDD